MKPVVVTGAFDDLRSHHIRFLQEAARLGPVHLLLYSDQLTLSIKGKRTSFPEVERFYFLNAIRFVSQVTLLEDLPDPHQIPQLKGRQPAIWAVCQADAHPRKRAFCQRHGINYQVITEECLARFPKITQEQPGKISPARKKVLVTGCYDWLHSGHIRFFEECSELGDLYVIVGHDKNVRALKGAGHPHFSQEERRYMVQAIRHVKEAMISTGHGWLDAEPEIALIQPDLYVVNDDGDKEQKRDFCVRNGIEYRVLKRLPKQGLTPRESTQLRGF